MGQNSIQMPKLWKLTLAMSSRNWLVTVTRFISLNFHCSSRQDGARSTIALTKHGRLVHMQAGSRRYWCFTVHAHVRLLLCCHHVPMQNERAYPFFFFFFNYFRQFRIQTKKNTKINKITKIIILLTWIRKWIKLKFGLNCPLICVYMCGWANHIILHT